MAKVIVEYVESGIIRIIDPKERPVVKTPKPKPMVADYHKSVNKGPESEWKYSFNCADLKSWKVNAVHARKNWMRHPHRIERTGGARILNELGRCYF